MRQTKRYHRLITSVISWMMAVAMMLGMIPAMTTTAAAVEPSEGGRITAAEANALLKKAGSGTELVEKALTEHIQNVNTTKHGLCGGASHLQGICVDDELKYMYFS